jgi:Ni/Co efflux regulator RcnB
MTKFVNKLCFALLLALYGLPLAFAQDSEPAEDEDGSSEQVEQRDDAFRRQMELEDARSRDRTYVDSTYGGQKTELEKIDKLPEESRNNIRDQLVDVIMENGEWEPKDALEEYPYAPTEAAQSDPELKEQEQEAWDEQIEKYHEREAAAFGAHRGPVPGPGNPTGQEGGEQGEGSQQGQQGGEQGSGQGGQDGSGDGESGDGTEGTYQPYQSSSNGSEDEVSTAGVSESALDFLRGSQGQQQPPPQGEQTQAPEENSEQAQAEQSPEQSAEQSESEQQQESSETVDLDTRGIIAIKDLDKLEGTEVPEDPDEQ